MQTIRTPCIRLLSTRREHCEKTMANRSEHGSLYEAKNLYIVVMTVEAYPCIFVDMSLNNHKNYINLNKFGALSICVSFIIFLFSDKIIYICIKIQALIVKKLLAKI